MTMLTVLNPEEMGRLEAVSPTETMMQEHGVLERVIMILERAMGRMRAGLAPDYEAVAGSAALIREYIQDFHEKNEERHIFPSVYSRPGMAEFVKTLRKQHEQGRPLIDEIQRAAKHRNGSLREVLAGRLRGFIDLYRPHKAWEDTVLFPAYRMAVARDEALKLGDSLEKMEHHRFGQSALLHFLGQTEILEKSVGITGLRVD